jgi:hypothetical protein
MDWQSQLHGDSVEWLLESPEPNLRYLALRDLLDRPPDDADLLRAQEAAHIQGPIATILDAAAPEGYWCEPGPGYLPKYRASVWSICLLAQLGAHVDGDERIRRACDSLLAQALTEQGQFTSTGTPSGTADCLQGNLCWALPALGCDDPRLADAFEWMARTVTGEGLASRHERDKTPRYYAGQCGPDFACGSNNFLPCAWGAAKVMLAFGVLPKERRTPLIERAIQRGVDFLFSVDPASAAYPSGYAAKPSGNWWKFGFPVFYVTDILQLAEALCSLGLAQDAQLSSTLDLIRSKQDADGRWPLEYGYEGKTWVDFGPKKQANPWVTLRALRVLKAAA